MRDFRTLGRAAVTGRVTMRDVARAVGVSPMTVSRALRDDKTVSAVTRNLIQKAAHELGYRYDTTALAFRTQKSGFVAITLPSVNNANFAETFRGLSDRLTDSGVQLLLGSTNYSVEREERLVRQLLARNPEAIVLTGGTHTDATRKMLAAANLPLVEIWDLPKDPLGHVVGFSNADAMDQVVAHLAGRGRTKLAFVGAQDGDDMRGAARRAGVIRAARTHGLDEVELINAGPAPISMRQGAAAARIIGPDIARFDAVLCVSDPVAFGVLSECRRMGLSVPEDLAITGFGQFDVATVSDPRITTVGVDAHGIGVRTAALLQNLFDLGDVAPRYVDVGSHLVIGETS